MYYLLLATWISHHGYLSFYWFQLVQRDPMITGFIRLPTCLPSAWPRSNMGVILEYLGIFFNDTNNDTFDHFVPSKTLVPWGLVGGSKVDLRWTLGGSHSIKIMYLVSDGILFCTS